MRRVLHQTAPTSLLIGRQQKAAVPPHHIPWSGPSPCFLSQHPQCHPPTWSHQPVCPNFNLKSTKTDSTTIEAEISLKIIKLATPSVLNHLFNQHCPGYSKESHAALNHIWQTYKDTIDNAIFMSASDYCTQILAVSCLFIDQEDLPISICQALKNDLDSCLLAGCCTHFPD